MKYYVESDGRYPDYSLSIDLVCDDSTIELTDSEFSEFQSVCDAYTAWQKRLGIAHRK